MMNFYVILFILYLWLTIRVNQQINQQKKEQIKEGFIRGNGESTKLSEAIKYIDNMDKRLVAEGDKWGMNVSDLSKVNVYGRIKSDNLKVTDLECQNLRVNQMAEENKNLDAGHIVANYGFWKDSVFGGELVRYNNIYGLVQMYKHEKGCINMNDTHDSRNQPCTSEGNLGLFLKLKK